MTAIGFDRSEILRALALFHQPGSVIELRIPKAGRYKTISGYFSDPIKLADSVVGLANEPFQGYYITANPVQPDLLARSSNKYKKFAETTTSDLEIAQLRWLLIDLDPKRPAGISSTKGEHDAAISRGREIRRWLVAEMGWPAGALILADSGNGGHLPVKIDLENTPDNTALLKRCLAALDFIFSDDQVQIDLATFNPARIWKLYGTMARKGDSIEDRPHRMAHLMEVPEIPATVSREMLEDLAAILPQAERTETGPGIFDPKQYAEEHGAIVIRNFIWAAPDGGKWNIALLERCPFNHEHTRTARIAVGPKGERSFGCFHQSCKGNDWHALKMLWGSPDGEMTLGDKSARDGVGNLSIKPISIGDPVGTKGLAEDSTVRIVVAIDASEGNTKKFLGWISDCPVYIDTETVANDETEFTFKGKGAVDGREVCFTMSASDMADTRKFKAALINAFGARNRIGSLNFEMVQEMTLNTQLMRRVEIPSWDRNTPLLPGVDLTGDAEYRFSTMIPAKVYDGDMKRAKECLKALLKLHKYAPILVTAILGAPAFARWHNNDRFGVALWGLTGSLKTSIAQAALSVYGTGYLDDEAVLKHGKTGATQVGTLEVFASAGFLPQILDNVKTVDDRDAQQYIATIHAILEGKDKVRGKRDGGLRESKTFNCTPIITGEIRPEEASTSARILNLAWTRPDDLAALSYVQENIFFLPVIGYHWLRFLAKTDLDLVKGFSDARSRKMSEFSSQRHVNPGRLATIYVLLRSTWCLLCESPLGDVFREFTDSFVSSLDEAIEIQGAMVTEETEVEKFLAGLKELLASNPGLIQSMEGKTILGRIIGKWTKEGLFLLPHETLAELAKIGVFTQKPAVDSLTKALHAEGLLVVKDNKHFKAQRRVNGAKTWGWLLSSQVVRDWLTPSPFSGDTENDSGKASVPTVSIVSTKDEYKKISGEIEKSGDEKQNNETGGDSGDNGDSIVINNTIDSDLASPESVSTGVLTQVLGGDTKKENSLDACLQRAEEQARRKEEHFSKLASKKSDPNILIRVRFRTEYRTEQALSDDPFKYPPVVFHEGDILEVPAWKARQWMARGVVEEA